MAVSKMAADPDMGGLFRRIVKVVNALSWIYGFLDGKESLTSDEIHHIMVKIEETGIVTSKEEDSE
jgi:hypothetical protein